MYTACVVCIRIVYSLLDRRIQQGCKDKVTLLLYRNKVTTVCSKVAVTNARTFVQSYCLSWVIIYCICNCNVHIKFIIVFYIYVYVWTDKKATGGTNFGNAFEGAEKVISKNEHTVLVFLTDGQGSDNNGSDGISASNRVCRMTTSNKLLQFWVIKFCHGMGGGALDAIAGAGSTKVEHSADGIALNEFFVKVIAKKSHDFSLIKSERRS